MTCDKVRDTLTLLLYDEVGPGERSVLEDHFEECPACRREFDKEQTLIRLLDRRQLEPPPGLLAQCRRQLHEGLERAQAAPGPSLWEQLGRFLASAWTHPLMKPAGALALIAVGFFAARLLPATAGSRANEALVREVDTSASLPYRIRDIQAGPEGHVRVSVEETREIVLSGSVEDEPIQRALLAAARSAPDPAQRLDSLNMLRMRKTSPQVLDVLLHAVESDPSPGVRLKALDALSSFAGRPEVHEALARVITADENPGVRVRAIDLLVEHKEYAIAPLLQEVLEREPNNYIRGKCQSALIDMNASAESF